MADNLGRDLELGPVEARIEIRRARIAIPDLSGLAAGWRILSGFAQQDLVGTLGGEPVGQHGSCRAASDDDEVVHDWRFLLFLSGERSAVLFGGHVAALVGCAPATARIRSHCTQES